MLLSSLLPVSGEPNNYSTVRRRMCQGALRLIEARMKCRSGFTWPRIISHACHVQPCSHGHELDALAIDPHETDPLECVCVIIAYI